MELDRAWQLFQFRFYTGRDSVPELEQAARRPYSSSQRAGPVRGEIAATRPPAIFSTRIIPMNLDARHLAWLIQIATFSTVVLISLWVSPAVASALSAGYPVDAIFFAMRSMLARMRQCWPSATEVNT